MAEERFTNDVIFSNDSNSTPFLLTDILKECSEENTENSETKIKEESKKSSNVYLGQFKITYYYVADESDFNGLEDDTPIYDFEGNIIAFVPKKFACSLGLEGTGMLEDGRIINYFGGEDECKIVTVCKPPYPSSEACYFVLDPQVFPYGMGYNRRPLVPFLSIAVDKKVIKHGTVLYVKELDGIKLPDGTVHNGCVRADDTGYGIGGYHIDFFTYLDDYAKFIDKLVPETVNIYIDDSKCEFEKEHFMAVGASCSQNSDCWYEGGVCVASFPLGYCSTKGCSGGDCPDVGGFYSFCGDVFGNKMCVRRCETNDDCRSGYECRSIKNFIKKDKFSKGCVPAL